LESIKDSFTKIQPENIIVKETGVISNQQTFGHSGLQTISDSGLSENFEKCQMQNQRLNE